MSRYEASKSKKVLRYRCTQCKTLSPHDGKCFRCGCTHKTREYVEEIVPKRKKGFGISVNGR